MYFEGKPECPLIGSPECPLIGSQLQETEGRRGDLKIRCPYQIKRAFLLNLVDTPIEELKVQGNQVQTDFLGSQMLDIKIVW